MEQAKKRDHKIYITDIAVNKVPYIKVPNFTATQNEIFQQINKNVLKQAMTLNNSDEVACVYNIYTHEKPIIIFGDLSHVDVESDINVQRLKKNSYAFELAISHNHPSTSNFSFADIDYFISDDFYGLMTVITNQGEVSLIKKTSFYDYDKIRKIQREILYKYSYQNQTEIVKDFLKHCSKGGILYVKGN
ncbi:MAG: hypothetical protein J6M62_01185 [Selenomonadaceae bacterium]|nr:hypothetical protein [Selenomonadaceae bacterium]